MSNEFSNVADSPMQSARNLAAVTPNNDADLANVSKALWVGGAGNVSIIAADDSDPVTITGVAAGTILPIRAKRVRSTGTTATSIVSLY